jgi:hypothetical protein
MISSTIDGWEAGAEMIGFYHARSVNEYAQVNPARKWIVNGVFVIIVNFSKLGSGDGRNRHG